MSIEPRLDTSRRLEHVRREKGFETLKNFWKALTEDSDYDVSYEAVRNYHFNREAPAKHHAQVAKKFGVRLEWLITGAGETYEADEAIAERAEQEQPADALASRITSVTKWYGLPPEVEFCLAQFLWRLYTGGVLLEELEPHDYLESITEEQIRDFVEDNLGPALRTRDRGFPHYASALLAQLSVLYLNYFM